ncbi:KRAB domain-containing zinc finger protein [Sarotherodon galilaeus]
MIFKMTSPLRLRIILGEDDARKLILPAGTPVSIEDLWHTVKTSFGLQQDIRLQYQDEDFGNEFMNMPDISEVKDKGTLKVIFLQSPQEEDARTSQSQATESVSISSADTDDTEPISSSGSSPSSRHWVWPSVFTVPQFSSYPTDNDLTDVAEALVIKHPCLREQGSFNGCYGWKISLKYKMANLRTKLRGFGCTKVPINSIKNKSGDNRQAAFNVKKPKRAEVNYCPQHPKGETSESLEQERVAILSELTKRNNDSVVSAKMEKTFSYRRQEVLQGQPMVADFKSRWPALFTERGAIKTMIKLNS